MNLVQSGGIGGAGSRRSCDLQFGACLWLICPVTARVGLQRLRENFKLEDVQLLELLQIHREQTHAKQALSVGTRSESLNDT